MKTKALWVLLVAFIPAVGDSEELAKLCAGDPKIAEELNDNFELLETRASELEEKLLQSSQKIIEVLSRDFCTDRKDDRQMKKSRFTASHITAIQKQHEAVAPAAELTREHNVSSARICRWRSKFGAMDASMMKRLKKLEAENASQKKLYAEERLTAALRQEALEGKL